MARSGGDGTLAEYRRRRDFARTPEPEPSAAGSRPGSGLSFVVQKHDATRLHYDLRLEWDGVLKCWAVARGPSEDPAEKRLAVRTEDHPLAYGGFEGVIPPDEYGGGSVMLWDRGTFEPVGDFAEGLAEGKLVFRLHGERLRGEWTLVRMRPKEGGKRENWLLIRHREEGARPPRGDVLKKHKTSVASGRTMAAIARHGRTLAPGDVAGPPAPEPARRKARKPGNPRGEPAMPRWSPVQLATLVAGAPSGDEWLSELKYDGYRALIAVAGGRARIHTRNGKDWTQKYPGIAAAAARLQAATALIDGEVIAFDAAGRTDFSSLQAALKRGGTGLTCFCFDLLELDGRDIRGLPLVERKAELEKLLASGSAPLVYSAHVRGSAGEVLGRLCGAGHEGIVAKRAGDPYRAGRTRSWLKVKCSRSQEFVVGGFTPSDRRGRPFASVLIGVQGERGLVYKGRVGSFAGDTLSGLAPLLSKRLRKTSPFEALPAGIARKVRFVRPDLVAEIGFAEFTADGVVRHGVFRGLRGDKKAGEVVLEQAREEAMATHDERDEIAGVRLTSPDRVLFSRQGLTKADLAAHYERVAPRMLPLAAERLLSLVRCPAGEGGECFFQKHAGKGFPDQLARLEIEEASGRHAEYLFARDLSGIVAGVQMGTLEFHVWGSRVDRLEHPDRLVLDLDPDEGLGFAAVREAARDLRDRLEALGLKSLPLVTGGKGVHVVVPLERRAEWPQVKAFARAFAARLAEAEPERYVARAAKEKRKGRIFVDWLRNERGATAIAPYSTRARPGAPVATPLSWDELAGTGAANAFGVADMAARMAAADPWAEASGWRQSIGPRLLAAIGAAADG